MGKKKGAGDAVKMARMTVMATETARRAHLLSTAVHSIPSENLYASGKYESNPTDWMPCLFEPAKSASVPISWSTPQPPAMLETTPACMAALQMCESPL